MKATKYLSLAAIALMGTLASCHDDEATAVSFARPDNAVGINVTVGSLQGTTRSNPASADPDEAHLFNLGDQVCVSTDGQDPVLFQCTNADQQTWAEAEAGKFLLWTQNEMTFKAYYPATDGTSMTNFNLPVDQSTEAKIAQADYMTREQNITRPEGGSDISLELERQMARVIVRINGFNNQYFDDQKTVSNVRINSQYSTIDDGNGQGDITAVNPYQQGTGGQGSTFTALVVPGDGDSSADFITLTDGANNTLLVKGIPELETGNSYTFNLTVGKNRIEVASVTVTDWTNGTTLAGGQAQESVAAYTLLSAATTSDQGKVVCAAGHLHDAKTAVPSGCTAVGILGKVTATGHGLILALQYATSQTWNTINGWESVTSYAGTTLKVLPDDAARGTNLTSYTTLGETTVSNWAVAQYEDYKAIFTNLGSTRGDSDGKTYDFNVNDYITIGVGGTEISGNNLSATEYSNGYAWVFESDCWNAGDKTTPFSVRPVLGF